MEDIEDLKERQIMMEQPSEEELITKPQFDRFVSEPAFSEDPLFISKDNKLGNLKPRQIEKMVDMFTYTRLIDELKNIENSNFHNFIASVFNMELTLSSSLNAMERKLQTTQGYRIERKKENKMFRLFGRQKDNGW